MQATERFGIGTDPDGDGVANELTRADITACTLFQAALPVPYRREPVNETLRRAARHGEQLFQQIGCASCHIPALPLNNKGRIYTEPGPYNPPGNLEAGEVPEISVYLSSDELTQSRLKPVGGTVQWNRYGATVYGFQVHDIRMAPIRIAKS